MERLMVVCFTGNSGLTDYTLSLCRELRRHVDLVFVTSDSYEGDRNFPEVPSAKIFRRTRHYPVDIFRFVRYVLRSGVDTLLWQSWIKYPFLETMLVQFFRRRGIRVALTIHDLLPHYPHPLSKVTLPVFYRSFDALIVHSERAAAGLRAMGVATRPLVVPHGASDLFRTRTVVREQIIDRYPPLRESDFVVLFFGHIETRKGIIELLKASDRIADDEGIVVLVAGRNDLPRGSDAAATFERYRTRRNVLLHDTKVPFDLVQEYFTLAHVVAMPYLEGTTSGVLKMAMVFGRPVIANDVGDVRETMADWPGITLDASSSPEAMADAIRHMRAHYEEYRAHAGNVSAKFGWRTIAARYAEHLEAMAGGASTAAVVVSRD